VEIWRDHSALAECLTATVKKKSLLTNVGIRCNLEVSTFIVYGFHIHVTKDACPGIILKVFLRMNKLLDMVEFIFACDMCLIIPN
jgi:hypothetical protein